jgi:SH3-like domain-containing protein
MIVFVMIPAFTRKRSHMNLHLRVYSSVILTMLLNSFCWIPIAASSDSCNLRVYVVDKGVDLLNIRKRPNSQSQILGKLPGNTDVKVLKTEGNWMLITPLSPTTQNIEFQGQGWASTSLLGLDTRGYGRKTVAVRVRPSNNSREIGTIPSSRPVKLLSCKGSWAFVEKNGVRGWLSQKDQCAAPLTSCS